MITLNRTSFLDAPVTVESLHGVTFTNESGGHKFVISCLQNGVLQTLTGSVSGKFMRANNTTIQLSGSSLASIVNGKAEITLHQDCYNVPGRFQLAIFHTVGAVTTCIYACVGTVQRSQTGTLIDSGSAVPTLEQLLAQIEACQAATTAANTAANAVPGLIADTFSTSNAYSAGDYVYYNGTLYRFSADHAAGAWTGTDAAAVQLAEDVTELKSALYKENEITWARVLGSANGVFSAGNAACTPILETFGSVTIGTNARAVIYLYSGAAYLGKMNSNYQLDTASGSWGYYTGNVDVEKIIRDNSATGAKIAVMPTDGTTITDETVQTWGANHCDVYLYNFETVADANIIKNTVADISEFMPHDYIPLTVETTAGLVNKYNQTAGSAGYAYIKHTVATGEKYKVSGWYYGGNYPAYLLLNGDTVVSFHNETTTGAFNNLEVTIPQNATHIVINGYASNPASIAKYDMVKAGVGGAKSFDSILVGVGTDYAYNDINSAIVANPNSIISVDYGTYDTEIENIATDKQIIGKDRNLCVLFGTGRNYDTPPIEISGGIIKHLTVNMENASDASHKGYCLHSDTSACIGKTLIVEDCKFTCTGQHSIGMGIWQNENVLYKNCEFIFKDVETTPTTAPFFAHNAGTSDGVAVVRFHSCIFRGSGYALKLSSYSSNCTMRFEFIDCTFESDTLTGNETIWTDYVAGETHDQSKLHVFTGKMPLLPSSHGNNVSIVNA